MTKISIRRADADDQDDIADLHKLILPGVDQVEDIGDTFWWVAEDEIPIAFGALSVSRSEASAGYLSMAGVHPMYRGLGLQKRLIRARIKHARTLGWQALVTDTIAGNPPSINSLIACGFRAYRPQSPWKIGEACYWRLPL